MINQDNFIKLFFVVVGLFNFIEIKTSERTSGCSTPETVVHEDDNKGERVLYQIENRYIADAYRKLVLSDLSNKGTSFHGITKEECFIDKKEDVDKAWLVILQKAEFSNFEWKK